MYLFSRQEYRRLLSMSHFSLRIIAVALMALMLGFSYAAEGALEGNWSISVDSDSAQMRWWETIKYSVVLQVYKKAGRLCVEIRDQYGYSCPHDVEVTTANAGSERVFSH
jgi:hypothetical protein